MILRNIPSFAVCLFFIYNLLTIFDIFLQGVD